ncbi:MAG: hypothetical protein ISS72_05550 [Candidatus Brocadiae bacterium]|nr:hypothetical protein [Candidatus Brocadiia bacterium]
MTTYSMLSEIDAEGRFWLPSQPESEVRGRLNFTPGQRIVLELSEQLEGCRQTGRKLPIVLGMLIGGTPLTLLDSFITGAHCGAGGSGSCEVTVNHALIGEASELAGQQAFGSCRFGLTCLENWAGLSPIKTTTSGKKRRTYHAVFRFPEAPEIAIDELGLEVRLESEFWQQDVSLDHVQWDHRCFVKLSSARPRTLHDLDLLAFDCQNLLSLLVGQPVAMKELCLDPVACDEPRDSVDRELHSLFVQRVKNPRENVYLPEMLLPRPGLGAAFPALLRRWLLRGKRLRTARNIYFNTVYANDLPPEFRFLSLMRVVETYHRCAGRGTYLPKAQYEVLREKMETGLPQEITGDLRQSFLSRIKYANEYSLRKRLDLLVRQLPADLKKRLTNMAGNFVNRLVDTRNYFTHYDHELEDKAYRGIDLHWAAERLRIFLGVVFLLDAGVDPDILLEAIENCWDVKAVLDVEL